MKTELIVKEIEKGNLGILDLITPEQRKQVLLFIKEKALQDSKTKEQELKEIISRKI